jgi:ribosomal protein L37AE/L43A
LDNKEQENDGTKCPMCGRIKAVKKQEDHLYFCTHCDMQFDDRED